jgi:hypothetical protein
VHIKLPTARKLGRSLSRSRRALVSISTAV